MASSLTARFCDSVKPTPGRQIDHLDADVPGLALRVSARGRKVWTFRYRNSAAKQCRINIGVFSDSLGLAEARMRARRLQTLVDDGVDPASERRIAKSRERDREIATFEDLAMAYFAACEQGLWTPKGKVKRKRSLDDERNVYRLHVKSHLGRLPLREVTRSLVKRRLKDEAIRSKRWVSTSGRLMGGFPFGSGALLPLLKNRTYLGEIPHKGATFPGRHEAIVDHQTFDAAQSLLAANARRRREYVSRADRMLLHGLVFDADGQPMVPIIAVTRKRPYKYYGSAPLLRGDLSEDRDDAIRRIPAAALESLVTGVVAKVLATPDDEGSVSRLRALIGRVEVHSSSVHLVIRTRAFPGRPTLRSTMETLHELLDPGEHALVDPSHAGLIRVVLPVRLVVRGGRTWASGSDGRPFSAARAPDARMIRGLRSGHAVLKACGIDPVSLDPSVWRHASAPKTGRERRLAQLAFLAPDIQRAMMRGELTKAWDDTDWRRIPLSWSHQRAMFMAGSAGVLGRSTSQSRITTGLEHFSD